MYSLTINKMYFVEALVTNLPDVELPAHPLQEVVAFHKWVIAVDTLCWCAIMAVKFSFLVLFRRLIQGIKPLVVYWWIVTLFNIAALGYGISIYYVLCPHFSGIGIRKSNDNPESTDINFKPSAMHFSDRHKEDGGLFGSTNGFGSCRRLFG